MKQLIRLVLVLLLAFVNQTNYANSVENLNSKTFDSSNSVVICDRNLLGVHTVISLENNLLSIVIINTSTNKTIQKTLVRWNASTLKHGIAITGFTKNNENISILVSELKHNANLLCNISSANESAPLDISYESAEIGFGSQLQNVDYTKNYDHKMELVINSKNALKALKKWIDRLPNTL